MPEHVIIHGYAFAGERDAAHICRTKDNLALYISAGYLPDTRVNKMKSDNVEPQEQPPVSRETASIDKTIR